MICAAKKIAISLLLFVFLLPLLANHSIFLTSRSLSLILTLSLSPLLFSNLVSIRMLNLGRNDTYRVTRGKNEEKELRGRDTESGSSCRLDLLILENDENELCLHSCTVNDVWEYLLSTLKRQGRSIWKGRNSISYSYMHEDAIALTQTYVQAYTHTHGTTGEYMHTQW